MDVAGRRILITGASSGIGAALAERMAGAGATVGLTARRADRLDAVLDRCRAHAPASKRWVCDLAYPARVNALVRSVLDAERGLGRVDILVNNAGVPKRRHVTALDAATVDAVMRVNFLAPAQLTLALLPQMIERGAGLVVNVSSVAATLSSPGEAAYDASKAALAVFSEASAIDLWETGVRTLTVYPGVVDTDLFRVPDNDPMTADVPVIGVDELVAGVMDAIAADALEVYVPSWFKELASGKAANIDGFLAGAAEYVRTQGAGGTP